MHVLGRGLDPRQDQRVALRLEMNGLVGVEHELARGGAGRGRQTLADDELRCLGIERRMQKLIELGGVDAEHRLFLGDQTFRRHVDGDLQGCLHAPLTGPALQHPKLAFLDRELDVLDVAEMRFELGAGCSQIGEHVWHQPLERSSLVAGCLPRCLGQGLRRTEPRDHVLALRIDQILAVEFVGAG